MRNWSLIPFHPAKWPFFYGWMILIWGTMGVLMSIPGQTIGVSVFTDPLLEVLQISRDELSLAYMLGTICSSLMLPWAGKMYDKYGVRVVALVSSVGLGAILWFLSHIEWYIFEILAIKSEFSLVAFMFVSFMFLRFFGQGVLTMSSRNMMMQWFDKRRGFATGFSNVVVSLTFSAAPVILYILIDSYKWQGAWQVLSIVAALVFPIIIILFYRNTPEGCGLKPDGHFVSREKQHSKDTFPQIRDYTLKEVRLNYSFWVFGGMLTMQALFITGFTFHVVSIFKEAGLSEDDAIHIFQPGAVVAVVVTLVASSLADRIKVQYLLLTKGVGAMIGVTGFILLGKWDGAIYLIITGTGFMSGLFNVLNSVTWPRYYGRKHLGAISGQALMMIVFGSALGPVLFSSSLTYFGNYAFAGWICLFIYIVLTIAGLKAHNPQISLERKIKKGES